MNGQRGALGLDGAPCPERAELAQDDPRGRRHAMCAWCGRVTARRDADGLAWCGGQLAGDLQVPAPPRPPERTGGAEIGPCGQCRQPTVRYGPAGQPLCKACKDEGTDEAEGPAAC